MFDNYIRDRSTKVLRVRVVPDPLVQGELIKRLEQVREQIQHKPRRRLRIELRFQPN